MQKQKVDNPLPLPFPSYLKIPNLPGADCLTVLHPLRSGQPPLTIKRSGTPDNPVLAINQDKQQDLVELHEGCVLVKRSGPIKSTVLLKIEKP